MSIEKQTAAPAAPATITWRGQLLQLAAIVLILLCAAIMAKGGWV